jgi:alpha-amylase
MDEDELTMDLQVWISPVVKQVSGQTSDGSSYHGYWAQDIYSLNSNFGIVQDLKDLSAALHARGMVSLLYPLAIS